MKQKTAVLLITGLAAILSLVASQANAYTEYSDVQWIFTELSPGESYTGTFDIVNPGSSCIFLWGCDRGGYVPGTPLSDVDVAFLIFDVGGVEAEIVLGSDSSPGLQKVGIDEFVWAFHVENIDANMLVEGDLMDDGQLEYTVTNLADSQVSALSAGWDSHKLNCDHGGGDTFWLKLGKLEASIEAPIPEPSAALVFALGFGVIGTGLRKHRIA